MRSGLDNKPLVSVGVPVFNEEKHIYDLLSSIHNQKYPNMEVIISDNASTDGTWEIITEAVKKDRRFRAVRQTNNKGTTENFRYVLDAAKGEFFIWAGGHDVWGPEMIESLVLTFENNPKMVLGAPRTKYIDNDGNVLFEEKAYIDTRSATTPAGRVLLFLKQRERCNAFYGLHRRETLLKTLPWPNGSDLIGLFRIASLGDIVTNPDVYWCRRIVRYETAFERSKRYVEVIRNSGLVARFPYLVGTITVWWEIIKFGGSIADRARLVSFFLWNITLKPVHIKLLVLDTIRGLTRQ